MPDDGCPLCWVYAEQDLERRPLHVGAHLIQRYRQMVGVYHGTHWTLLGARGPHLPDPWRL